MITIRLWRLADGSINGFAVNGHADYAPKGQDIICAAVSAVTQAALLGLTTCRIKPRGKNKRGILILHVNAGRKQIRRYRPFWRLWYWHCMILLLNIRVGYS